MNMAALIKRWIFAIVIIPGMCTAQLVEDFSDGDFTINPQWGGDVGLFKVNDAMQLQLDDDDAGQTCLSTQLEILGEMEWRCWVKMAFSPSGNNNTRIYLFAEQACSDILPDGIFLQLGEGGSSDAIRLMHQVAGDTATLIRGSPGAIAQSFSCNIKIVFENDNWQLFADFSGGEDYTLEGQSPGILPSGNGFLSIICNYTVSNNTKFYFDDFYVGPIRYDTIPPQPKQIFVSSPLSLEIHFSESIDVLSAGNIAYFELDHNFGSPYESGLKENEPSVLELYFSDTLLYGSIMQLSIRGVTDLSGNEMLPVALYFSWYHPQRFDVVINEIMADPSPPQLLPEYEYLELFNTTPLPLDLSGWVLTIGTAEKALTHLDIAPQGYLIIGKEEARELFATYGSYYGLESFSLVNTGQNITLTNEIGEIIHSLYYTKKWYNDDQKAEGGWSMEQLNPLNPCLIEENWQASLDATGGSPGSKNSAFEELFVDTKIETVCALDSVRIRIEFNQMMHKNITLFPEYFIINRGIGIPLAVLPDDPFFTSFILYPEKPLNKGYIYELTCNANILSCTGEPVYLSESDYLGLAEKPGWQDLVINEILFNPFPGGTDYVEIYNRSQKVISLTGLSLASVHENPPSPADTSYTPINMSCKILLPGEYALLCKDFRKVDNYYSCPQEIEIVEPGSFPSYSNECGKVIIFDAQNVMLDAFTYNEDMHYPLLNSVEGVSLERIHFDQPTSDITNWHSASQLSGFGTPGYENSQISEQSVDNDKIWISPKVFTPGYDGLNDHTSICYDLGKPGYLATIMIFSASGQLVRHLVNNELLGSSGSYSWNGVTDNNQKASAGMYVVLVELIDIAGSVLRYKKAVALAP